MQNDQQRRDQSRAYQEKVKKRGRPSKVEKEWYEAVGNKVVKKIKLPNGNVHSSYVGPLAKHADLLKAS